MEPSCIMCPTVGFHRIHELKNAVFQSLSSEGFCYTTDNCIFNVPSRLKWKFNCYGNRAEKQNPHEVLGHEGPLLKDELVPYCHGDSEFAETGLMSLLWGLAFLPCYNALRKPSPETGDVAQGRSPHSFTSKSLLSDQKNHYVTLPWGKYSPYPSASDKWRLNQRRGTVNSSSSPSLNTPSN